MQNIKKDIDKKMNTISIFFSFEKSIYVHHASNCFLNRKKMYATSL